MDAVRVIELGFRDRVVVSGLEFVASPALELALLSPGPKQSMKALGPLALTPYTTRELERPKL